MTDLQVKETIQRRLADFGRGRLAENALALFDALGYRSDKRIELAPNTAAAFCEAFDAAGRLNPANALLAEWRSVDMLFQLTGDEVTGRSQARLLFDADTRVDNTIIQSYLFFAIELTGARYTRSQLAGITREINKLFPMPAMILFRHGPCVTLSIINRRLNKRDEGRDVLEKVTLIKDIAIASPHRAHIEILFDLSLDELYAKHGFGNFVELHNAWQKTLDTAELNKRFFREVANWYFWAVQNVQFPKAAGADPETRNATSVIRLITRLIFVWFLKEKGLVPETLFDRKRLDGILNWSDGHESTFCKAILQNLFFATLNQEMNTPGKQDKRVFRKDGQHYNITNLYRYRAYFRDPDRALALFASIPFLNGGLFECLDKPGKDDTVHPVRVDGFSDRPDNELSVPDRLFFGTEQEVDLNAVYDTRNKRYKVRGLIPIFDSYKFTVTENTPIEEEVALDPELLGKVFENLLAAYNPETGVTARKQTGSFYTPREIVDYMVDESLIAYLTAKLASPDAGDPGDLDERLRHLFSYTDEPHRFTEAEIGRLIEAIDNVKILDPAAGSGAFPMGILHKLVFILAKLDPGNERWKDKQIAKAAEIADPLVRERAIADIEQAFAGNELDYGRKLYLIQNCIYGVDIQPIAVQIAKLRCFISLVAEQRTDDAAPNRGILPLPNLETNFVAANTLLGIQRTQQFALRNTAIDEKEDELARVRQAHFTARTPKTKARYRERDRELRQEIAALLEGTGLPWATTEKLAHWDPYDQNAAADFFDPEWMLGVTAGFDVVIGNPPYLSFGLRDTPTLAEEEKASLRKLYPNSAEYKISLYAVFMDKAIQLTRVDHGVQSFIVPDSFLLGRYFSSIRNFILSSSDILQVVFLPFSVFGATVGFSVVYLLRRTRQPTHGHHLLAKLALDISDFARRNTREFSYPQSYFRTRPFSRFNLFFSASTMELVTKIEKDASELGESVVFSSGLISKYGQKSIISESRLGDDWLPGIISGGEIAPYSVQPEGYFLHYQKAVIKSGYDNVDYFGHKLFLRQTGDRPICAFDDRGLLALNNVHVGTRKKPEVSLKYVMALLNSSLMDFYYRTVSLEAGRVMAQTDIETVERLPIRWDSELQSRVEATVDRILTARRADPAASVSALEREIDQLVYRLYGLTAEEIAIVEERNA